MKDSSFTVYIERDEDGMYIGLVPSVPSCYAQGKTQEKMLKNLQDVLRLCLRNMDEKVFEKTTFVGIQNVKVKYA